MIWAWVALLGSILYCIAEIVYTSGRLSGALVGVIFASVASSLTSALIYGDSMFTIVAWGAGAIVAGIVVTGMRPSRLLPADLIEIRDQRAAQRHDARVNHYARLWMGAIASLLIAVIVYTVVATSSS
jgi:hypothetical protein